MTLVVYIYSGAFFMRRSFAEDPLYWACFSEYVQETVGNGDQPLEFFIEGTRSRTGKCLHPKVGLMGAALRPFFEGRVNEVNLLPIAVTYEERMETHLYADEMLGTPKPKVFASLCWSCGYFHICLHSTPAITGEFWSRTQGKERNET